MSNLTYFHFDQSADLLTHHHPKRLRARGGNDLEELVRLGNIAGMNCRSRSIVILFAAASYLPAEEKLSFNRDIRPILSDKCYSCHGYDAKQRKGELRLDTKEGAYAPAKSGEVAVKPGDPSKSELLKRLDLAEDDDDVMPPKKTHKTVSASEKALLRKWIEQGAPYQKHWAFEPPVKAAVPEAAGKGPIDAFLLERLKKDGLNFLPAADKSTLLRRVTFTLTGLPPTPAETDAFLADNSPDAYDKAVDRLLASPAYGEEMGRHWLDVARYGDTHGLHLDNERSMWLYRDWVVGAFNRNLPFDQFSIEQLGGDLLPNPTPDQQIATGFNRCNVTTSEGGAINEEFIYRYAVDRTATTIQTWLGLTGGCAVCHDHKFDPLSMKEFYSMYAFFNSTADPAMDGNALVSGPTARLTPPEYDAKAADLDGKRKGAEAKVNEAVAKLNYCDPATMKPLPPATEQEMLLVEDEFPAGAKTNSNVANSTKWVSAPEFPVASGQKAFRVSGTGVTQEYYQDGAAPIEIPAAARISLKVFLDPANPPKAIMLQCHREGWNHRVMWGDEKAIPGWGKPKTGERYVAGALPNTGQWVSLEVPVEKLDLKQGDKLIGLAFTLDGGTAYFDKLSFLFFSDDAHNPNKSLAAWLASHEGHDTPGVPAEINKILKSTKPDKRNDAQKKQLHDYYCTNVCTETKAVLGPLVAEVDRLTKARKAMDDGVPVSLTMKDLEKPRDSFVMLRGAYDKPGDKVEPGVPAVFPPLVKEGRANRLDLAKWLVSNEHPLTARVTVNRFWIQAFGIGIVKSAADFGSQGQLPSHPELLDYLSVTFRESGWDVKKLMRSFVTSDAFKQTAAAPAELWKKDPENRLLARGPRMRLEAEQIRDNALFVSGLLDKTMGGRGVRPYQPPNIWEPVAYIDSNTAKYKADQGPALYRRSLYTFLKRTAPPPFMANFDGPSREQSCPVRERSNTPMQALQLMNDIQHVEAARALAQRVMVEGGDTPESRIRCAYRIVLARDPRPEEACVVKEAFDQHLANYQKCPEDAGKLIRQGESKPKEGLAEPELAAWTLISNLVLNLDETVNRN